jgi:uncharacterized protein (TIGR03437 family)
MKGRPAAGVTESVRATIGDKGAAVALACLAPGFAGLCQVNLIVPDLTPGGYPLRMSAASVPSSTAVNSIR